MDTQACMMLVDSDNLDLDIHSQDRFHYRDTLPCMALVDSDNLQFRKLFTEIPAVET